MEDIAIIATDAAGAVTAWNHAAQRLYGWRAAEAMGRSILELTPSQQSRGEAAEIMATLQRGEAWSGEIILRRKDGQVFRAYVKNFPVGEGVIVGVSTAASQRHLLDAHRDAIQAEIEAWASSAV